MSDNHGQSPEIHGGVAGATRWHKPGLAVRLGRYGLAVNDQDLLAAVAFAIAGTRIAQSFARPGYGVWFVLDNQRAFSIECRASGWDIADVTDCL